jgi:D-aminoacyl-tRNA deacylase
MILIVASTKDVASMNIRSHLISNFNFEESSEEYFGNRVYLGKLRGYDLKLVTLDEELIFSQRITDNFLPDLIVYISRHSSKSGKPTFSVHTPGNLAQAEMGGEPRKVSISPATTMKKALLEMEQQRIALNLDYQVSYECTHHGPSLDVATMFVELGSSPIQWNDSTAAEAVAYAAMAPMTKHLADSFVVVGIGGPHYNEKFTRMALEDSYAFGHIIPKYMISKVDKVIMQKCIERTVGNVKAIILDWKGIRGKDKLLLKNSLEDVDVEIQRV